MDITVITRGEGRFVRIVREGPQGIPGEAGAPGVDGSDGTNGTNGQGVPVGGAADQVLAKIDGADFNTAWVDPAGAVASVNGQTGVVTLDADDLENGIVNYFMSAAQYDKLTGIEAGAQVNTVTSVNGQIGAVSIVTGPVEESIAGNNGGGTEWDAASTVVRLTAGGIGEDELIFLAPSSGVVDGHHVTLVNSSSETATVTGLDGDDVTIAGRSARSFVYSASSWFPIG